jgi:hypothetical protein
MADNLANQKTFTLGRIVLGGLIAAGLIGGGFKLADFNSAGAPSSTVTYVAQDFFNAYATATGSTTIRYPSVCITNPLLGLAAASGTVVRLSYQNIANPTGIGGDIGFTKGCGDSFGSGQSLINDTCTGTGCRSYYTTGTAGWNSADKIKFTLRNTVPAGFSARIRATYEQNAGNH